MDTNTQETQSQTIDSTSPYYLHPACNTNLVLSPVVLRGDNYGEWARSVRNAFKANNKLGFLDGTITQLSTTSPKFSLWIQVNSMLTAWLQNTLDASIRSTVPLTDNVKDMWDDLQQRFSIGNGPRINELRRQIYSCSQSGESVVAYYGRLRKYWEELQGYLASPCSCPCNCGSKVLLAQERDDERTHQFLIGLDPTQFSHVQSNMLMQDPLPSLNTVFSKAITEERNLSLLRSNDRKTEAIGFATQVHSQNRTSKGRGMFNRGTGSTSQSNGLICTHCHKSGHDQSHCFELIGYPDWWYVENRVAARGCDGIRNSRGSRGGKMGSSRSDRTMAVANAANNVSRNNTSLTLTTNDHTGVPLSTEQWQHLMKMFTDIANNTSVAKNEGPQFEDPDWSG
ncbi:unnamed protein product [Amaranthus hypochondriacus]